MLTDLLTSVASLRLTVTHRSDLLLEIAALRQPLRQDRRFWIWLSRRKPGRPRIPAKHIAFIQRISRENPLWGERRRIATQSVSV